VSAMRGKELKMSDIWEVVTGSRSEHDVVFYGLSTCVWCKKTKKFLEDSGVGFRYVSVDLVPRELRDGVLEEMSRHNPNRNFPTVVIDGSRVVVGYNPDSLTRELGL
jgi:glutaredoxin-like protein NrdH